MSTTPKIDDGGPAFPCPPDHLSTGMTLRDWFAGQALATVCDYQARGDITPQAIDHASVLAAHAYNVADAMIRARPL